MPEREEINEVRGKLQSCLRERLVDIQPLDAANLASAKLGCSSTTLRPDLRYRRKGETILDGDRGDACVV